MAKLIRNAIIFHKVSIWSVITIEINGWDARYTYETCITVHVDKSGDTSVPLMTLLITLTLS